MLLLRNFDVTSKFRKKIIFSAISLIVLTTILEIWAVNRLATYGEQITRLERTKQALVMENQVLENEIATKTSLKDVYEQSKNLGYEKIGKIEYLEDRSLALNH